MAYSTNPITVERMRPYLDPLVGGGEVRYHVPGRARWLAYRIREALSVAQLHSKQFPVYAELAPNYRVEVRGDDEVCAVIKPRVSINAEPLHSPPPTAAELIATESMSPDTIVQEWQREGRTSGKLYFPNADLGPEELLTLYDWAQETGVLIFENLGAVTLLPLEGNEDAAEFAWDPSELEETHNFNGENFRG